jgi:hypothetical protein
MLKLPHRYKQKETPEKAQNYHYIPQRLNLIRKERISKDRLGTLLLKQSKVLFMPTYQTPRESIIHKNFLIVGKD